MKLGDLRAEVEDDRIIVTLPGTTSKTIYVRSSDEPQLVQARQLSGWEKTPHLLLRHTQGNNAALGLPPARCPGTYPLLRREKRE